MPYRALTLALALLTLTGPAHAAEKSREVGQYVDLQPVALPIVVQGRLVNYVFVYVRVNFRNGVDIAKVRDNEPMFRDALVREGHRTPFVVPSDWKRVDEAKLVAALTRDAAAITGPDVVSSVVVTSQAPQKSVVTPRP
jgi:hypothetical protein